MPKCSWVSQGQVPILRQFSIQLLAWPISYEVVHEFPSKLLFNAPQLHWQKLQDLNIWPTEVLISLWQLVTILHLSNPFPVS
jgi:hypothetical protein